MRFGLWRGVIRGPALAMGGLAGLAFYVEEFFEFFSSSWFEDFLRKIFSSSRF